MEREEQPVWFTLTGMSWNEGATSKRSPKSKNGLTVCLTPGSLGDFG